MRILIAEDEEITRDMLQAALREWGYDVVSACDGQEAWAVMQGTDAPQLAVLDWMMPEIEGPDLCRELRNQEREDPLYLILLTAKADGMDVVQGLEAGADDYITKPYDITEVQARTNVGRRMITLQNKLRERERFQGALEMAGAACHELNQPLQVASGYSECLLLDMETSDPNYERLQHIKMAIGRIGESTRKIMKITRYTSKPYTNGSRIIDIETASQEAVVKERR